MNENQEENDEVWAQQVMERYGFVDSDQENEMERCDSDMNHHQHPHHQHPHHLTSRSGSSSAILRERLSCLQATSVPPSHGCSYSLGNQHNAQVRLHGHARTLLETMKRLVFLFSKLAEEQELLDYNMQPSVSARNTQVFLDAVLQYATPLEALIHDPLHLLLQQLLRPPRVSRQASCSNNFKNIGPLLSRINTLAHMLEGYTRRTVTSNGVVWNVRTETVVATLFELLLHLVLQLGQETTPTQPSSVYHVSQQLQDAWTASGHHEALHTILNIYSSKPSTAQKAHSDQRPPSFFVPSSPRPRISKRQQQQQQQQKQLDNDADRNNRVDSVLASAAFLETCYDVLVSTDTHCPANPAVLADVLLVQQSFNQSCDMETDPEQPRNKKSKAKQQRAIPRSISRNSTSTSSFLVAPAAPIPQRAQQVLDVIQGEPLPRTQLVERVLRRILPHNTQRNDHVDEQQLRQYPMQMSLHSARQQKRPLLVAAITSETIQDDDDEVVDHDQFPRGVSVDGRRLGQGSGKTTVAALVAQSYPVRQCYSDGIVWVDMNSGKEDYNGNIKLTYDHYRNLLQAIVVQISDSTRIKDDSDAAAMKSKGGTSSSSTRQPVFPPSLPFCEIEENSDEEDTRERMTKLRQGDEGYMTHAHQQMVDFLADKRVLIILDDFGCTDADDWKWFQFADREGCDEVGASRTLSHGLRMDKNSGVTGLLVTTNYSSLFSAAQTVEMEPLPENQAVALLQREAFYPDFCPPPQLEEIQKQSVRACRYHPLAVASIGRVIKHYYCRQPTDNCTLQKKPMKMNQARAKRIERCLQHFYLVLDAARGDRCPTLLTAILHLSLSVDLHQPPAGRHLKSPITHTKIALRNFMNAFPLVFRSIKFAATSPLVPLAVVELMFKSVLMAEPNRVGRPNEPPKVFASNAVRTLSELGLLCIISSHQNDDQKTTRVRLGHVLHANFGSNLIQLHEQHAAHWNGILAESLLRAIGSSGHRRNVRGSNRDNLWNRHTMPRNCADKTMLMYALQALPMHMLRGNLWKLASQLLSTLSFVADRIANLGVTLACTTQIEDTEALIDIRTEELEANVSLERSFDAFDKTLGQLVDIDASSADIDRRDKKNETVDDIRQGDSIREEVAEAYVVLGNSAAKHNYWNTAISLYIRSERICSTMAGTPREKSATLWLTIGTIAAHKLHDFQLGLDYLDKALRVRQNVHGATHILSVEALRAMSDVLYCQGEHRAALEGYDKALKIMSLKPRLYREEIGITCERVGRIHESDKWGCADWEMALQSYEIALKYQKATYGENHPKLCKLFRSIGLCHQILGDKALSCTQLQRGQQSVKKGSSF